MSIRVKMFNDLTQSMKYELINSIYQYDDIFGDKLCNIISECGWPTHSSNGLYLYTDYIIKTRSYIFSVRGSQYIKDSCLCEFELEDEVEVTKLSLFKRIKNLFKSDDYD